VPERAHRHLCAGGDDEERREKRREGEQCHRARAGADEPVVDESNDPDIDRCAGDTCREHDQHRAPIAPKSQKEKIHLGSRSHGAYRTLISKINFIFADATVLSVARKSSTISLA
jgi:hypothetical protein